MSSPADPDDVVGSSGEVDKAQRYAWVRPFAVRVAVNSAVLLAVLALFSLIRLPGRDTEGGWTFAEPLLACLLLLCLCTLVAYIRLRRFGPKVNQRRSGGKTALLAIAVGLLAALAALCKPNVQYLSLLWLPAAVLFFQ